MESVPSLREHPSTGLKNLRQQFGQRLRAIRIERSFTQERFAELVGISVDFLSIIERGIGSPSFENLESIADRLDLEVKDLFDFPNSSGKGR